MSCTPGVEQKRPHFTPGVLNWEFYVATIISQVRAIWKPAAAAIPSIAQRVTIGSLLRVSKVLVHSSKISWGLSEAFSSLRSCPAEKAGPYPLRTRVFRYEIFYFDFLRLYFFLHLLQSGLQLENGGKGHRISFFRIGQCEKGSMLLFLYIKFDVGVEVSQTSSWNSRYHMQKR